MPRKSLTKKRAKLLAELEAIIGNNCYNGNIQNWGPGGVQYGDGRSFRYPLTTIDQDGKQLKTRGVASIDSPDVLSSGYYAFGANRLNVIAALNKVIKHLEENHGLKM
ncbi:MAG: hypothetical protein QM488_18960 [Rhizobiaceae bacterium]